MTTLSNNLTTKEDWYMYYVASPYTHPEPDKLKERYELAVKAAKALTKLGYAAFVPIAYDGLWDLDPAYNMDHTWKFWEKIDLPILDRCSALILFEIPGWDKSTGVKAELAHCNNVGIPILSISLSDLENDDILVRKMTLLQGMIKRNRRTLPPLFNPNLD